VNAALNLRVSQAMELVIIIMPPISRSMELCKITCIPSLYSSCKLSFPPFSIFSFFLYLPVSSSASQIINEFCSSNSFYFLHLSFNGIIEMAISS